MKKQYRIPKPTREEHFSISEIFHENTKMRRLPISKPSMSSEVIYSEDQTNNIGNAIKVYLSARSVKLPMTFQSVNSTISIQDALLKRRSIREYSEEPLTLSEVSNLLFLSCGITAKNTINEKNAHYLRAYPSAGGLYPLEIYPVIFRSVETDIGLYHYNVRDNAIELLEAGDLQERLSKMIMFPEIISKSSLIFLITAVFPRTLSKYNERGYRFVLLEAGHLAQNVYLSSTALGIGCVAIGGFIDDELNNFLGIDGVCESVIYALALGKQ